MAKYEKKDCRNSAALGKTVSDYPKMFIFMGETRNTLTEVKERLSAVERLASDTAKRLDALESKERERR